MDMAGDECFERPLFGGAISSALPLRFQDVSNIRPVPNHQEVFTDPSRDESIIFELLDLKHEVQDSESATWFLQDLANEQDATGSLVIEQTSAVNPEDLLYKGLPAVITAAVGQMVKDDGRKPESFCKAGISRSMEKKPETWAVSKGRQGWEARNVVRAYLANLRLKGVGTDVLITAYEPLLINPLSESARTVGAGVAVPATVSGCLPVAEVIKNAVSTFKVNDWNLFNGGA